MHADHSGIYTLDILPYSYQQEILDRLDAERTVRGYNRNLVVAATGTGKTVISALDYKRFCKQHPGQPCRLLFVAHREEILKHPSGDRAGRAGHPGDGAVSAGDGLLRREDR